MEQVCFLCGTRANYEGLGEMHKLDRINVHGCCLVFCYGIRQNDNKNVGLYGFEMNSIKRALLLAKDGICIFCGRKRATVKCAECEVRFHLPCAISKNKSLHLFFGDYKSYCINHAPQCIFEGEAITGVLEEDDLPSCCHQLLFHEHCIIEHALKAKRLSNCPNCRNQDKFQKYLQKNLNVSIPQGIPAYAIAEDTSYHLKCAASKCLCKKGKFHHAENTEFELISCFLCGSDAVHRKCGNVEESTWICFSCTLDGHDMYVSKVGYRLQGGKLVGGKTEVEKNQKGMNNVSFSSNLCHKTEFNPQPFHILLDSTKLNTMTAMQEVKFQRMDS